MTSSKGWQGWQREMISDIRAENWSKVTSLRDGHRFKCRDRGGLDLLEQRLVESHTTVIIRFDDRVIFVGLLRCAEFSHRLSEVAQTLDAISGIQFLIGGRWLGEASRGERYLEVNYELAGRSRHSQGSPIF
jgi:hypothetical protein